MVLSELYERLSKTHMLEPLISEAWATSPRGSDGSVPRLPSWIWHGCTLHRLFVRMTQLHRNIDTSIEGAGKREKVQKAAVIFQ